MTLRLLWIHARCKLTRATVCRFRGHDWIPAMFRRPHDGRFCTRCRKQEPKVLLEP